MLNEKHLGSDFDDFLREEGLLEEVKAVATKRVLARRAATKAGTTLEEPNAMEFEATQTYRQQIAKRARLRAGESRTDEVALPEGEPADFRQLRQLRELAEQLEGVEAVDSPQLLEDLDRAIIDKVLSAGGLKEAGGADRLGAEGRGDRGRCTRRRQEASSPLPLRRYT